MRPRNVIRLGVVACLALVTACDDGDDVAPFGSPQGGAAGEGGAAGSGGGGGTGGVGGAGGEAGDDVASIRVKMTPLCEQPAGGALPTKPLVPAAPIFTRGGTLFSSPSVGAVVSSAVDDRAVVVFSELSTGDGGRDFYVVGYDGTAFGEPVLLSREPTLGRVRFVEVAFLSPSNQALIALATNAGSDRGATLRFLTFDGAALSELGGAFDLGERSVTSVALKASSRNDSALLAYELFESDEGATQAAISVGPGGPAGPFVLRQRGPDDSLSFFFAEDVHALPSGSGLTCMSEASGKSVDCFSFAGGATAPAASPVVEGPNVKTYLYATASSPHHERAAVLLSDERADSPDPYYSDRLRFRYAGGGTFGPLTELAADAWFASDPLFVRGEDHALAFYGTRSGTFWSPLRAGATPTRLPAWPVQKPLFWSGAEGVAQLAYPTWTPFRPGTGSTPDTLYDVVTGRYERGAFGPLVAWPVGRARAADAGPAGGDADETRVVMSYLPERAATLVAVSCAGAPRLRAFALGGAGAELLAPLTEAPPLGTTNTFLELVAGAKGDRALTLFKQAYSAEGVARFDSVVNLFDGREFSAPRRFSDLQHAALASGRFLLVEKRGGAEGNLLEVYVTD